MDATAHRTTDTATATTAIADLFTRYAKAAAGTAFSRTSQGDTYGAMLATGRAEVYDRAAELVLTMKLHDAAGEMIDRARNAYVRTPPMIDFDAAGVCYVVARAWQFCAWKIDPTLPEVAPAWP